jgi:5-(carboxyamino)imidazole ribonucleotide mutase
MAARGAVVSAHRTMGPDLLFEYASHGKLRAERGAGGAHRRRRRRRPPARHDRRQDALPVLGVPVQSKALNGIDSLLSIVQMPAGVPVATFAIGAPAPPTPRCWLRPSSRCNPAPSARALRGFRAARPNGGARRSGSARERGR